MESNEYRVKADLTTSSSIDHPPEPILLTWINFDPVMDK